MLEVPITNIDIKRTYRPTYGWTQQTPQAKFLDPAYDRTADPAIVPGMVMVKGASGDLVDLIGAVGNDPIGFAGEFVNYQGIDEVAQRGLNAMGVWVMGPDAEAEVDVPAFDDGETWTDPSNNTVALVHAQTAGADRGKLCPAGVGGASTLPVARLIEVVSDTTIVIGGLLVSDAI